MTALTEADFEREMLRVEVPVLVRYSRTCHGLPDLDSPGGAGRIVSG